MKKRRNEEKSKLESPPPKSVRSRALIRAVILSFGIAVAFVGAIVGTPVSANAQTKPSKPPRTGTSGANKANPTNPTKATNPTNPMNQTKPPQSPDEIKAARAEARRKRIEAARAAEDNAAQGKAELITDRFSTDETVELKNQKITPTLIMNLDTKRDTTKKTSQPDNYIRRLASGVGSVTVTFSDWTSGDNGMNESEPDLIFLIDNKKSSDYSFKCKAGNPTLDDETLRVKVFIVSIVPIKFLKEIAKGRGNVEMKLGKIETRLSPETIANIREFVAMSEK